MMLDRILGMAERLIAELPADTLDLTCAERGETIRDLAFHLFRESLVFADGMDFGRVRRQWFEETAPRDLDDGRAIARYGALVRGRLAGWFEGAGPREYSRLIDDLDGPRSGHDLLERTTRNAADRLRRLYLALDALGIQTRERLPNSEIDSLGLL